jgi:alkyldihydroxyacetonephosphate synthase
MDSQERLIQRLSEIVGAEYVATDARILDELSWDALSEGRIHPEQKPQLSVPRCAVSPAATVEIQKVVRLANNERIPIVPYGGGSGLMGGALSVRPGIVMDVRRMNRILEVDKEGRRVRVEAGAVLEDVEKRLNEEDFILGHDPWTVPVATVGGAISTNSMGYRGGIYGSMGQQVLGLEAVLPDAVVLTTRGVPKSSTGIDLKLIFIGGEGCFGIITEATVRIFPRPEKRAVHGVVFDSFEQGYVAIQRIFLRGLKPAMVDFGDNDD